MFTTKFSLLRIRWISFEKELRPKGFNDYTIFAIVPCRHVLAMLLWINQVKQYKKFF